MLSRLFLIVSCLILVSHGARQAVPMKTYKLDLNDPPETRWNHIMEHYLSSIPLVIDYFDSMIPKAERALAEYVMADLEKYMGEYGREIKGIAEYTKIDLGLLVGLNLAYELRRLGGGTPNMTGGVISDNEYVFGCTSIVAKNETGHIFHGRNMDWNLPNDMRNMTSLVQFYRGDKYLFTGAVIIGYVGILTGVSPHGFSLSINARAEGGNIVVNAMEGLAVKDVKFATHLAREVLVEATSYNDAHQRLASPPLVCPVYYIMAGTNGNEGAVLSRGRNDNPKEQILGSMNYGDWYLMETNYDYWKSVPATDNRRAYAHHYIQTMGRSKVSSMTGLLDVLSTWPVWNSFTAYTALMDPSNGKIEGYDIYDYSSVNK